MHFTRLSFAFVLFVCLASALAQSGGWPTTTTPGWGSGSTGPSCTGVKPTLSSGQTWVANAGCSNGGTYNTASNQRCRCWSHCGYICGSATTPTPGWGTAAPTTQGWTAAPTTTQGWTAAPTTTQGWTAAPTTTQGWTAAPTTTGGWGSGTPTTSSPCTNVRPILSSGQTWVANAGCTNGSTYNNGSTHCHCWSHCGYICGAKTTTTTPGWTSG